MITKNRLFLFVFLISYLTSSNTYSANYKSLVKNFKNVRKKLYSKNKTIEISLPSAGFIPNQSYINSLIVSGEVGYYLSEAWGLHFEVSYIKNFDKEERYCLEHFYNDPNNLVAQDCPDIDEEDVTKPLKDSKGNAIKGANFGPVYPDIQELKYLAMLKLSWNPVYGKQIAFLSFTSYFDLFMNIGVGFSISDFYKKTDRLKNGGFSRGPIASDFEGLCPPSPGICPSASDYNENIGAAGRPTPEPQSNFAMGFGIGQKFQFLKSYHLKIEAKNYTLIGSDIGTNSYFKPFYAISASAGARF